MSISDIKSAMSAANLSYPSGSAESGNLDLSVSTLTQHDTLDELLEMPITVSGNKIIYLEDIAVVSYAEEQKGGVSRYNGEETISISPDQAAEQHCDGFVQAGAEDHQKPAE